MYPENLASTASRYAPTTCCSAFFPPTFDPVLDGGKRNKDPVIPPEMPTGRTVRQVVLDHQPHGPCDDAVGVVALGRSQLARVRTKVTFTSTAIMLGGGEMKLPRSVRD